MPKKIWSDLNNFAKLIPGYALGEELVDHYIREKVEPVIGSIVYCNLGISPALVEHSGIYIGNGQIVELQGKSKDGKIAIVNRRQFLKNRNLPPSTIWVACYGDSTRPIGDKLVAKRAKAEVDTCRKYNLFSENCHRFTSGCITGNFKNNDTKFWALRNTIHKQWGDHCWRAWQ